MGRISQLDFISGFCSVGSQKAILTVRLMSEVEMENSESFRSEVFEFSLSVTSSLAIISDQTAHSPLTCKKEIFIQTAATH